MSSVVRKIVPLLDRVLIERVVAAKKSPGGVILPESATSKLNEGTVVATGPGGRDREGKTVPLTVSDGDRVLLPEYGGTKIEVDGKELYLYRDDDILAKME